MHRVSGFHFSLFLSAVCMLVSVPKIEFFLFLAKSVPFRIEFFSDGYEYSETITAAITTLTPTSTSASHTLEGGDLTTRSKGFKVSYTQSSNNC